MGNRFKMGVGIGAASIIMVFVILVQTTLASLSLVTANSDLAMAERNAAFVSAYYEADGNIQQYMAQLAAGSHGAETLVYEVPLTDKQWLVAHIAIENGRVQLISQQIMVKDSWDYEQYEPEFSDIIIP